MPRKQYTIHYIYKTVNIVTGRFYVGMHSTFNVNNNYLGSGKRLWYSIKKYGKENHKKEILEFCKDRVELKIREKEIVNTDMIHDKMCMNLMEGGKGGYNKNAFKGKPSYYGKLGREYQIKLEDDNPILAIQRNKNISNGLKSAYIEGRRIKKSFFDWSGKKHSKQTIKKMKDSAKGKHLGELNSQFGTIWITNEKENKKIKNTETIPMGWKKGRKIKYAG